MAQTIFRQNLSFGEQLKRVLFFFRLFATGPTGWPRSGINLAEPCGAALMTSSRRHQGGGAWTDESWPGRMMRGPKRLGSTTGFSGAKFAQKTRERLRRRTLRSSEDLLSKKGAMRKMEICGPNFCQIFTDLQISNPSDPMSTCFSG